MAKVTKALYLLACEPNFCTGYTVNGVNSIQRIIMVGIEAKIVELLKGITKMRLLIFTVFLVISLS